MAPGDRKAGYYIGQRFCKALSFDMAMLPVFWATETPMKIIFSTPSITFYFFLSIFKL